MPRSRTNIYIDGLNLYYGAVKGTPYKWLNIEAMCRKLRPHDDIQNIYYFTALVSPQQKTRRQLEYLRALETLPLITTILGKFKRRKVKCGVAACSFTGVKIFRVPEEKRTDVNIAIQMLDDAYNNEMDLAVLMTGDSDLVPAVDRIKTVFPEKKVYVYIPAPHRGHSRAAAVELRGAAGRARELPMLIIQRSLFPSTITGSDGRSIKKPAGW
jgi:uncharacterized LabA/DUF88 family protein